MEFDRAELVDSITHSLYRLAYSEYYDGTPFAESEGYIEYFAEYIAKGILWDRKFPK